MRTNILFVWEKLALDVSIAATIIRCCLSVLPHRNICWIVCKIDVDCWDVLSVRTHEEWSVSHSCVSYRKSWTIIPWLRCRARLMHAQTETFYSIPLCMLHRENIARRTSDIQQLVYTVIVCNLKKINIR